MARERRLKPEGYKCPVCGVIFPKPESLGGHVTRVHRDVDLDLLILMKKSRAKH